MKNTEDRLSAENKPKFNIADIIILIIIVAVITAFGLRIYNIFGTEEETYNVRISFEVEGVSSESVSIKENDVLYTVNGDIKAGYIESFSVSDTVTYAYNEAGELVSAKVPGKSTVTGTIVLTCTKSSNWFYLGGTTMLTVGNTLALYTPEREMSFEILGIEEVSAE